MSEFIFNEGDIIEWCEEHYEVVENRGDSGVVRHVGDTELIAKFYWHIHGEKAKLVRRKIEN